MRDDQRETASGRPVNHLENEKSPYLRMHRYNPVDWYPWGEEALSLARGQDKPIFLSIGYSACHWCHVIARESFEDADIAARLNEDYVSVKVDKEERPDIDKVYMDAVELTTGAGGWPMTLLLTPDAEPFFAATYLPKESRDGAMGLSELLGAASKLWKTDKAKALRSAHDITKAMRAVAAPPVEETPPTGDIARAGFEAFERAYDEQWGGFGRAPKFPSAHNLLFLLAYYERVGAARALTMATQTLDHMYCGGLFDHLGGGFCRYSVDRKWLVPHFEKMLYDNALLLWAYAEAFAATERPLYAEIASRTADFILRDMTSAQGAFFCALDADSEGREGAFYLFTPEEIKETLGEDDGEWFCRRYGVMPGGNFEGKSILNLIGNYDFNKPDPRLPAMRDRLLAYRKKRLPLARDDKALTSWNALTIAALCASARALGKPEHLTAAKRAEAFLSERMISDDGGLLLRYRDGESKGDGVLSDYAYLALAEIMLYDGAGERKYLTRAETVMNALLDRFSDGERGGYFLYSVRGERLITRPKETWDAAMPSGNSAAALALVRLAELSDDARYAEAADRQLSFLAGAVRAHPTGHGFALYALERRLKSSISGG